MSNPSGQRTRPVLGDATHGLLIPGVFDAISARIAEQAGFTTAYISGTSTAAGTYGVPDLGIIGRQEMVKQCSLIRSATGLTLIADADTGYGNAVAIRRTVQDFIAAGADAITLEDQLPQKQCGYTEGVGTVGIAEMQRRIESAVRARGTHPLAIIGRTDALAGHGVAEVVLRANAMRDAGADVVWILGLQHMSARELTELRGRIGGPAMIDYTELAGARQHTFETLTCAGFEYVLVAMSAMLASVKAIRTAFRTLRETGDWQPYASDLATFEDFNRLAGMDEAIAFETSR